MPAISLPRPAMHTPWYKQAWPWGLILGPLAVVIASIFSAYLAIKTADPLVVDDYYKQGLAINQSLARDQEAARLGLNAGLHLDASGQLTVTIRALGAMTWPAALNLVMQHPSRVDRDHALTLLPARLTPREATYTAHGRPIDAAAYDVVLRDAGNRWQLSGRMNPAAPMQLTLLPQSAWQPAEE